MAIDFPIPVLTGPTAVGKTELSLSLAEEIGAEIISVDSRQIYKPLSIGTAKPNPDELARVPHHFINELDLDQDFSAGQFARQAEERISEIGARGHIPLIVGGSTLYLHALQFGLANIPDVPKSVRKQIEKRLNQEGQEALYAELQQLDPSTAQTMDPTKTQRLVRALEVYHGTGQPLSSYEHEAPRYSYTTVVLHRDRAELYGRINERVDRMLEKGLLDEVQTVMDQTQNIMANPLRTIGYQEPISYLQGEIDYAAMVRLLKRNSRRYAKRQLTWFRRYPAYRWLEMEALRAGSVVLGDVFKLQ
ncbi:MAG TPA: tRNA (adenosine(37)-N6)-dimethylallyltransferase MiaA [Rhodothermales bacterium]|nr:tRNA (adenosine(37)-N6)-dimethylallyltransferase MiaA [Rhodothermales bacterium]